ncbi:MAG: MarR family winged helix-turn-helix transcriptional regulator [Acidimicrobiales bacterium]
MSTSVRGASVAVASVRGASGPGTSIDAGLGFRLGRLARVIRRGWAAELAPLHLSPPQAAVLRGVNGDPGCSLRALARALSADPMSVKHCVDELEGRGLIRSGEHPTDRRRRMLTATEAGQAHSTQIDALAYRQQLRLDGALTPSQRDGLESAVEALERALGVAGGRPFPPPSGVAGGHEDQD